VSQHGEAADYLLPKMLLLPPLEHRKKFGLVQSH
jgi:hypothetical protein